MLSEKGCVKPPHSKAGSARKCKPQTARLSSRPDACTKCDANLRTNTRSWHMRYQTGSGSFVGSI